MFLLIVKIQFETFNQTLISLSEKAKYWWFPSSAKKRLLKQFSGSGWNWTWLKSLKRTSSTQNLSRLGSEQEKAESSKKREEEQVKLQNQMHREYKKNVEATFEKMQANFNQSMKSAIADLHLNLKDSAWKPTNFQAIFLS